MGGVDVQIDDAAARGVTACHCRRSAEAGGSASGCVVAREAEFARNSLRRNGQFCHNGELESSHRPFICDVDPCSTSSVLQSLSRPIGLLFLHAVLGPFGFLDCQITLLIPSGASGWF
jgi:hypothetical protein